VVKYAAEVLGLGAPIVDLVVRVSDEFLAQIPGELGGRQAASMEQIEELVRLSGEEPVVVPGGSTTNLVRGMRGFGRECGMIGVVGGDAFGDRFVELMGELPRSKRPTSVVLCLVAPSGQRTMRSCMQASDDLGMIDLEGMECRHLHVEGYALFGCELAVGAMERAPQVSLDLASFEVVRQCRGKMVDVLSRHVDIVFANSAEARELTGQGPEEACDTLAEMCEVAVVMMGKEGAWIRGPGEKFHIPAQVVEQPLDTTGAGDLFAAGFLHGRLSGQSLKQSGQIGATAASAVVQVMGAAIPSEQWPSIVEAAAAQNASAS
jgi:sugar/nucleoside kinase (ribokinase family)